MSFHGKRQDMYASKSVPDMTPLRRERAPRPLRRLAVLAFGALALAPVRTGAAQAPLPQETPQEMQRMADSLFQSQFPIDDRAAEIAVPSAAERDAAPLEFATFLMELAERADRATQARNHRLAAKYLRALTVAVPGRAAAFSQLCRSYELGGEGERALSACASALQHPGVTSADYEHYVQLVLAQPGPIPAARVRDLDALLAHLDRSGSARALSTRLRCEIGVRLRDVPRLTACTQALRSAGTPERKVLGYEWLLAMEQREYDTALAVLQRGRSAGMRADAVDEMERATLTARSPLRRALAWLSSLPTSLKAGVALACAALLGALYAARRRRRPLAQAVARA
jgi:hypothetical protein